MIERIIAVTAAVAGVCSIPFTIGWAYERNRQRPRERIIDHGEDQQPQLP